MIKKPLPGMQTKALAAKEAEILLAGRRAGGKSVGALLFLIKGFDEIPVGECGHASSIDVPGYRAIVVLEHKYVQRLWLDAADDFFRDTGVMIHQPLSKLTWPSGASVQAMNANPDTAEEFHRNALGFRVSRIVVEDLENVGEEVYRSALQRLRPRDSMKPQILSTASGLPASWPQWMCDRFMQPGSDRIVLHPALTEELPQHALLA